MDSTIYVQLGDGVSELTVHERYQWDNGVKLQISGAKSTESVTVQYANDYMTETLNPTCTMESGIAVSQIPNTLFMLPYSISCYINVIGTDSSITIMRVIIPIVKRAKPSGYVYTPEEIAGYEALMQRLNQTIGQVDALKDEIDTSINAANSAADSAKSAAGTANSAATSANNAANTANSAANTANNAAKSANNAAQSANDAASTASVAATGANEAAEAAQKAADNLNGISFELNLSDGCLYLITPGIIQGYAFTFDPSDGCLYMEKSI